MKVVLTNLSNSLFEESRTLLNESAKKQGITDIESWDFEELKQTTFFKQHQKLLEEPKGLGFWAWKAFIILDAFSRIDWNDIVIYADCGQEIIANLDPIINICQTKEDILLFENGNLDNATWTKRDCFIKLNCDSGKYWYGLQTDASFLLVRKTERAVSFLNEWLVYCCDWQANTNNPNTLGKKNLPSYIEHRWDQSILSLLRIKWNIELYRMPSQFGNHYKIEAFRIPGEINCRNQYKPAQLNYYSKFPKINSPYFQLLNHHRKKKSVSGDGSANSLLKKAFGYPFRLVKRTHAFVHQLISSKEWL